MSRFICVPLVALALSTAAHAADIAYKAKPLTTPWDWTGFYFGAHTGAAWSATDWQTADGVLSAAGANFEADGLIGGKFAGAQAGFNWQTGPWVLGAELSGSWADIYGDAKCFVAYYVCNTKADWFGTATGRVGWSNDHVLYYAKGGAAVVRDKYHMNAAAFTNIFDGSDTRWGWTVGAGIEYALTPAWSVFAEYDYMGFGTDNVDMTDQFGNVSHVGINQNVQTLKFGINYRPSEQGKSFGPGPLGYAKAPLLSFSGWTVDFGTRVWISSGKMKKDLYDPFTTSQLNSRLTYGDELGGSLEGFIRFDHTSGLFAKGFLGFGTLGKGGNLLDEDFPPGTVPYSATNSDMHDGKIRYGGFDVGHIVTSGAWGKVGPFVGYRFYYQQSSGFGCAQVATSTICVPTISTNYLGLSETETWRGVAVGLNGIFNLSDRFKLAVDAAYLPYVDRSGFDNHWFRADINPQVETGHGWGTQLQAILSYAVTSRWSVGIGGRYWYFKTTSAETRFPGVANPSPMEFETYRYGGFFQASYKFDPSDVEKPTSAGFTKAPVMATNWTGFYIGGHAGGGFGSEEWNSATGTLANSNPKFPGSGDVNGLVAGGQIGYNYQMGRWVFGAEADASWSNFYGNAKCATFAGPTSGTCNSKINALGSFTGKIGYTVGRFLYYGKGGVAWANEDYSIKSYTVGPLDYSGSATSWGWTLGGGIAYALTPHWSLNAEYDYSDFGDHDVAMNDPTFGASTVNISQRVHVFKLGANYRFWTP